MMFEKTIYLGVWTMSIIISLLKFTKSCENHHFVSPGDFEEGWKYLNHMKDISDTEWIILTSTFKKYWMLLLFQVVCSQFILRKNFMGVLLYYGLYSIVCLTYVIGVATTLAFVLYIALMYLTHLTGRKSLCYFVTVCSLLLLHNPRFYDIKEILSLKEAESFLFDVGLAWLMAKSLSFSIDRIDAHVHKDVHSRDIIVILAYCLYLPAVFTGPILSYENFCKQMLKTPPPMSSRVFWLRILHLIYQTSLFYVYEFLLHYVFSSSVQFYPDFVSTFDCWSLCGLGYALPMMFYLKYYVIYGVAGSIARLENLTLPPPPKCISCIHLSSFLWRHFDRGLYLWILRYLYHPLINGKWNIFRRICALSVCFSFISLWHGMDKAICMWCALNCLLVASEIVTQFFSASKIGAHFQKIPPAIQKRLRAAFETPHFIMMCISCSFFLSNWDIGILLIKRMLLGGIIPLGTLSIIMYCGCHVSMNSKQWQRENPLSVDLILN